MTKHVLKCDFLTLFPGIVQPVLEGSILGRSLEKGLLDARVHDIREFTEDPHRTADDTPYGGGRGDGDETRADLQSGGPDEKRW